MSESPVSEVGYNDGEKIIYCQFHEQLPISELKKRRNPENRNKHPDDQVKRLAKQMKEPRIAIRHPIVVSKLSGRISKGHGRLLSAELNGFQNYPVQYQEYADAEAEYQDAIADNALALWAELDLGNINLDLEGLGPDFDIDLLGIKDFVLEPADKYADKDADEVPEVKGEPIVQPGELWILGKHRLLCGDSTSKESVERLLSGEKPDMVYTDPPYGIDIDADYGKRMKGKEGFIKRQNKTYSNIIGDKEAFDPRPILNAFPDSKIFLWGANNYTEHLPKGGWFVWYKKTTDGMKKMFGWDFELCWTNQSAGQVYEQSWAGCFGHNQTLDGETKTHPSMKSVQLIIKNFQDYEGEKILDLYLGSGSTLIACEKTDRKCFGMEIDPHYCSVILERWAKFTGKDPIREDGTAWSTIKNAK